MMQFGQYTNVWAKWLVVSAVVCGCVVENWKTIVPCFWRESGFFTFPINHNVAGVVPVSF